MGPALLVGEQQGDRATLGAFAGVGSAGGDVRQLDGDGWVGPDVFGEDGGDLVVEVDVTDGAGLGGAR